MRMLACAFAIVCIVAGPALADVQGDPRPITWANCHGSITTGGTAQTLSLGPAASLRGFTLQNPSSATESLFFEPNGTASTNSLELIAGAILTFGPGTIFAGNTPSVYAATTGHTFKCYYGL